MTLLDRRPASAPARATARPALRTLLSRPSLGDAATALSLAAIGLVGAIAQVEVELPEGSLDVPTEQLGPGAVTLILWQTLPLIWRRIAPVLVLVLVAAGLTFFFAAGYFPSFASLGILVAVYTVAAHRPRGVSVGAGVGAGAVLVAMSLAAREPFEIDAVLGEMLVVAGAWVLGDGVRARRIALTRSEGRAASLELAQERRAREAVAQERRLIARELHDVVAHHVGLMVAQAGAASFARPDDPAAQTLSTVERLGRAALVEMRRLTGVLRTEADRDETPPPSGRVHDLDELVAPVRAAGIDVVVRVEGTPRPVPAGLSLSAYRIVQEALTNVMKHARATRVDVVVRYAPRSLGLVVEDDGAGTAGDEVKRDRGFGLLGMRERVALFDGELRVGPRRGGGFRVVAYLPLDDVAEDRA
jgi:signal transduction histidine kinase